MLVSIIIPFYNEERYLERAVYSAIAQTYPSLEIILVDDGSTDRSPAIAEALCHGSDNIRLIRTPNKGLGAARNTGMAKATGTYLTFLDSDDCLAPDAIATWVKKIEAAAADIVIGKFRMINKGSGWERITGWKGDGALGSGADGIRSMYEYRMSSTAWAKLYRMDIARDLRFPEGLWFEDRPFLLSYFLKAKQIIFEESPGLDILSRQDSITRGLFSERRIKDSYRIYELELDLVSAHAQRREFTHLIDRHQVNALIEALIILYYDRAQLPDRPALEACLAAQVAAFIRQLKQHGNRIGIRDRLDLLLLRLQQFIGWRLTYWILPVWKRKKCRAVLALKSF